MFQSLLKRFKDASIQTKIFGCFSVVTLALTVALGSFSYKYAADIIMAKTIAQSGETITQISQNIEHNIRLINEKLSAFAFNPMVQEQLSREGAPDNPIEVNAATRLMSKFMVQVYHSAILRDLQIYGEQGQDYYISSNYEKETPTHESAYIEMALEENGRNMLINDPEAADIQIVKSIRDVLTQKPLGVLRASLRRSVVENIIKEVDFASNGSILVLDKEKQPVAGNDELLNDALSDMLAGASGSFTQTLGDEDYVVSYQRSSYTGWITVGIVPEKSFARELFPLRSAMISMALVSLVLCLLLARVLSNTIARPLAQMVSGLQAFSIGDFTVRMPVGRRDEIGHLREGFNQMTVKIESLIEAVYMGEILKKDSEFKALQAQINPHFLYNTLESINWLARREGMEDICRMVTAVGNLMRISISNKHSFIPVSDELRYVSDYMYIQRIRYRDRIRFHAEVEEGIYPQVIPKLILQPIVENAVVHGCEQIRRPVEISLSGWIEGGDILFVIRDTGRGIAPEEIRRILSEEKSEQELHGHTSLGIRTVHRRIQLLYGSGYGLSISSETDRWTKVTIRIPFQADPQELLNRPAIPLQPKKEAPYGPATESSCGG